MGSVIDQLTRDFMAEIPQEDSDQNYLCDFLRV